MVVSPPSTYRLVAELDESIPRTTHTHTQQKQLATQTMSKKKSGQRQPRSTSQTAIFLIISLSFFRRMPFENGECHSRMEIPSECDRKPEPSKHDLPKPIRRHRLHFSLLCPYQFLTKIILPWWSAYETGYLTFLMVHLGGAILYPGQPTGPPPTVSTEKLPRTLQQELFG